MSRNFCLEQLNIIFSLFCIPGSVFFPGDTKMDKIDTYCLVERKTPEHCSVRNRGISKMTLKQKNEAMLVCKGRRMVGKYC